MDINTSHGAVTTLVESDAEDVLPKVIDTEKLRTRMEARMKLLFRHIHLNLKERSGE